MIWRIWFVLLVVIVAGAWALMVPLSPAASLLTAGNVNDYRKTGLVPKRDAFRLSTAVGHDVFEEPASDAEHRKAAEKAAAEGRGMTGHGMGGMTMTPKAGGPGKPESGGGSMQGAMPPKSEGGTGEPAKKAMPTPPQSGGGHGGAMGHGATEPRSGETAKKAMPVPPQSGGGHGEAMGHGATEPRPGEAAKKAMPMPMPPQSPGEHREAKGHEGVAKGIRILAAVGGAGHVPGVQAQRTVKVEMREWSYSPPSIEVKPGEVVRFVVTNGGNLPHEFMLMTGPAMQALNYRIERSDWNLLEHEAIFERPVVMPGDTFTFVARFDEPGMWMFMCMFPNHMQLGMMGMMMSGGAQGMGTGSGAHGTGAGGKSGHE